MKRKILFLTVTEWLAIGVIILVVGFVLMTTHDPNPVQH
jgi:hypothetical protein